MNNNTYSLILWNKCLVVFITPWDVSVTLDWSEPLSFKPQFSFTWQRCKSFILTLSLFRSDYSRREPVSTMSEAGDSDSSINPHSFVWERLTTKALTWIFKIKTSIVRKLIISSNNLKTFSSLQKVLHYANGYGQSLVNCLNTKRKLCVYKTSPQSSLLESQGQGNSLVIIWNCLMQRICVSCMKTVPCKVTVYGQMYYPDRPVIIGPQSLNPGAWKQTYSWC